MRGTDHDEIVFLVVEVTDNAVDPVQVASYEQGVVKWGDKTTAKRKKYGSEAFAKISELWNAA